MDQDVVHNTGGGVFRPSKSTELGTRSARMRSGSCVSNPQCVQPATLRCDTLPYWISLNKTTVHLENLWIVSRVLHADVTRLCVMLSPPCQQIRLHPHRYWRTRETKQVRKLSKHRNTFCLWLWSFSSNKHLNYLLLLPLKTWKYA